MHQSTDSLVVSDRHCLFIYIATFYASSPTLIHFNFTCPFLSFFSFRFKCFSWAVSVAYKFFNSHMGPISITKRITSCAHIDTHIFEFFTRHFTRDWNLNYIISIILLLVIISSSISNVFTLFFSFYFFLSNEVMQHRGVVETSTTGKVIFYSGVWQRRLALTNYITLLHEWAHLPRHWCLPFVIYHLIGEINGMMMLV